MRLPTTTIGVVIVLNASSRAANSSQSVTTTAPSPPSSVAATESPIDVSIAPYAAEREYSSEAVWEQLSSWKTALCRVSHLEHALTTTSGEAVDPESAA